MKSGFTLIEVIIGLAFSSIIAATLYNSFFLSNRVAQSVGDMIDSDLRLSLMDNQLQKDISGVFIPQESGLKEPKEQEAEQTKPEEKGKPKQPTTKPAQQQTKPLEKIFYSANKNNALSLLTFITNNPLTVYQKADNSLAKPRMVRVVYQLVPDLEDKNSWRLMRQESTQLDFKAFEATGAQKIRAYELANNIKTITAEFIYPIYKEQQGAKAGYSPEEMAKPEYKNINVWQVPESTQMPAVSKQPKIPQFVTLHVTLWNNEKTNEHEYSFTYEIAAFKSETEEPKKPPTQAKPKEKPAEKPPTSGQTGDKPNNVLTSHNESLKNLINQSLEQFKNFLQGKA